MWQTKEVLKAWVTPKWYMRGKVEVGLIELSSLLPQTILDNLLPNCLHPVSCAYKMLLMLQEGFFLLDGKTLMGIIFPHNGVILKSSIHWILNKQL